MRRILPLRNLLVLFLLLAGFLGFWLNYQLRNQPGQIKIGMTLAEVEAALGPNAYKVHATMIGQPSCMRDGRAVPMDGDEFHVWVYQTGIQITIGFRNGVVSDFCKVNTNYS